MIRRITQFLFVLLALVVVTSTASAQGGKAKKGAAAPAAPAAPEPDPAAAAPVPAPAQAAAAPHETKEAAEEDAEDAAHHHPPRTIKVALILDKLTKFEVGPGTYNAEFYLFYMCDATPCKPEPEMGNGKITGKDKVADEDLVKVYKLKTELDAQVDLSEFPFDRHVLPIAISDKDENITYVHDDSLLKQAGMPTINPEIKLAGWSIDKNLKSTVVTHKLEGGLSFSELTYNLNIERPRLASFFKTLVPVFFMIFVAGFTLLLKPKSAAGRLTAATGGLMTVVMFHLSATGSLPPLGYLTRMDKFMIATYVVYLFNILFAVAIVRFDEKKNEKMAELLYLAAGGAVPGIALLAWLTVFLKVA